MHRRGQGTFEYVLLLGGVLLVVVLALFVLQGSFNQSTQGLSEIELKKCKAAAAASPMCSASGSFDPVAVFSALEVPEGTLCDCSNYNPDASGGADEEVQFSRPLSALYFEDALPPQAAGEKPTVLKLRRRGDKLWFVAQHRVSSAYVGPLTVVLPVPKSRITSIFPSSAVVSSSTDGASTILSFAAVRLFAGQSFNVVAYLTPDEFKTTADAIRAQIPSVTAAKPSDVPSGFSEFVHTTPLVQSAPSCLSVGQSCANPLGPGCCTGLSCDVLGGLVCKAPSVAAPSPSPSPSPSATPIPACVPSGQGCALTSLLPGSIDLQCCAGSTCQLEGLSTLCKPTVSATPTPVAEASPSPSPTASSTPSPSTEATPNPEPVASPVPETSPSPSPSPQISPSPSPAAEGNVPDALFPVATLLVVDKSALTEKEAAFLADLKVDYPRVDIFTYKDVSSEALLPYPSVFVIDFSADLDVSVLTAMFNAGRRINLIGPAGAYADSMTLPAGVQEVSG